MAYSKKITTLSVLLLGLVLAAIGGKEALAQVETITTASDYSFGLGKECMNPSKANIKAKITNGNISVLHKVNPNSGTIVQPGDSWTFNYDPDDPKFNANNGNWDTPYGMFCNNINTPCFGLNNITNVAGDVDSPGSWKISGSGYREGYIYWTAVKPNVSISSSNPSVISCNGMTCTANLAGSAKLTANIEKTPARIWAYIFAMREEFFDLEDLSVVENPPSSNPALSANLSDNLALVANRKPVADAGEKHVRLPAGHPHTHSGASATDRDGNLASYAWTLYKCPSSLSSCPSLSDASGIISGSSAPIPGPTYTADVDGYYYLRLTVTDTNGNTGTDNVNDGWEDWFWASGQTSSMLFPFSPFPGMSCSSGGSVARPYLGTSSIDLAAEALDWDFTVGQPPACEVDLKVNGSDHKTIATALVKNSGDSVRLDWTSSNTSKVDLWGGDDLFGRSPDSIWPKSDAPPNDSRDGGSYTLPTVAFPALFEYKASCTNPVTQNGFWNKLLSFFGFAKKIIAQAYDYTDSVFVRVNPSPSAGALIVNVTVSLNPADIGQIVTWQATGAGGTPPYTYTWSGTDGLSGLGSSVDKSYATAGNKTGTVIVTDSLGVTASNSEILNVNPLMNQPVAILSASPTSIREGKSSTLNWRCENSTQMRIDSDHGENVMSQGCEGNCNGQKNVYPNTQTRYTLTCSAGVGDNSVSVQASVNIQVIRICEGPVPCE